MIALLLAADDNWLGWIVPIVVVVIYVLSHIWNLIQGQPQQQQRPNQPQRPDQKQRPRGERPLPGRPQQGEPANQGPLNAEIEEFLRRANERREAKTRRQVAQPEPTRPSSPPRRPTMETALEEEPERRGFDSVAASVQQHFGARPYEERERELAEKAAGSDVDLEAHLREAFGHRLGTFDLSSLDDSTAETASDAQAAGAMARAVAGLLVNQENVRQAVLLKEILERPVDRW